MKDCELHVFLCYYNEKEIVYVLSMNIYFIGIGNKRIILVMLQGKHQLADNHLDVYFIYEMNHKAMCLASVYFQTSDKPEKLCLSNTRFSTC